MKRLPSFFFDKEDRRCHWQLWQAYVSALEILIKEFIKLLLFHWSKGVDLSDGCLGISSIAWSHCFQSGNSSKDSLVNTSLNYWYVSGTMSLKWVDQLSLDGSVSCWEIDHMATLSSSCIFTNCTRNWSPGSISSGCGCMKPGGFQPQSLVAFLEPLLYVLNR